MRLWPFGGGKRAADGVEEFADVTTTVLEKQYERAVGSVVDLGMAAGVEICRGAVGRAFATARWPGRSGLLTAADLMSIGRSMVHPGESVWVYEGGRIFPVADFDITGGLERHTYVLQVGTPDGTVQLRRNPDTVLHFRFVTSNAQWWRGDGPMVGALATGQLAARIEGQLNDEAGGTHGYLIPTTEDPRSEDMKGVAEDLRVLRGRSMLVQSVLKSIAGTDSGHRDWVASRVGMNPPDVVLKLRDAVARSVLGVLGVPPNLFLGERGDGGGGRESWRRFLHGTIEPMGAVVSGELERVFGAGLGLDFSRLGAHDVAGQARAVHVLQQAGVDLAEALRLAGMDG